MFSFVPRSNETKTHVKIKIFTWVMKCSLLGFSRPNFNFYFDFR